MSDLSGMGRPGAPDPEVLRRLHQARAVVAAAAATALIGIFVVSGEVVAGVSGLVMLASGALTALWLRRGRGMPLAALTVDALVLIVAAALLRPPAILVVGPIVYLTLAAVLLLDRREALRVIAGASAGITLALTMGSLLAPRAWESAPVVLMAVMAFGATALSIAWLLRAIAEKVDVGERRLHRIAVQELLLGQVHSAVIVTDLDGTVVYWNPHAETMYGWKAGEVLGRNIVEVNVPERSRGLASEIVRTMTATGAWQGEFVVRRRDGSEFPAMVSNVLVRHLDGTPIGIAGVSTDLSDLRRIEEEARSQGEMAHAVLESVDFPVAVVRHDGEIATVNRAWAQFAIDNGGRAETTGVGTNYLEVTRAALDDPDAAGALAGLSAVLDGSARGFDLEYPCHGPGQERWYRMSATPLPGVGAVVAHWSTTEAHLARRALEETISAKDRFIATVSHELRTPLTAVLGLSEELRDGSFDAEETDEFHRLIADQARDLAHLVEDLLVAARLDGDSIAVEPEILDLEWQVEKTLDSLRLDAAAVDVDESITGVKVWADPVRLRQVLRNLIGNADRHGRPPIRIATTTVDSTVRVEVIDHGPGVTESIRARVFDPYVRAGDVGGTPASIGLGLFISRRLVMLMGGELSYSRRGGETVFTLEVPAHEARRAGGILTMVEWAT